MNIVDIYKTKCKEKRYRKLIMTNEIYKREIMDLDYFSPAFAIVKKRRANKDNNMYWDVIGYVGYN